MFPKFTIIKVESNSKAVIGKLDRIFQGKEKWIDDNYIGALLNGSVIAFGRWFKEKSFWRFQFNADDSNKLSLNTGATVYAIDGYWGERIEIVYSTQIDWKKEIFKSKKNWDHEHCAICWAKISEFENTEYYLGGGSYPVCKKCYKNYVLLKVISFVPSV